MLHLQSRRQSGRAPRGVGLGEVPLTDTHDRVINSYSEFLIAQTSVGDTNTLTLSLHEDFAGLDPSHAASSTDIT